ncbi:MAG TPA: alpha/beta hydrolase [Bacteroidia bacterium]|nr:alpha/beta hydrolase [Bacteroidia bacterium]
MKKAAFVFLTVLAQLSYACGGGTDAKTVMNKNENSKPVTITFPSLDSLTVTADMYVRNDSLPWMLLCHQAGYSRGEYIETAQFFMDCGYNCLAIDQRSGNEVNGVKNETAALAKKKDLPTDYLSAEQDIVAGLNYLFAKSGRPVVLVGSSYSAGLVLKIATGNPEVKAVLSFSPGEYYDGKFRVAETVKPLDKPVFITSAKREVPDAKKIFDAIGSTQKTFFSPTVEGVHASSCLWSSTPGYEEYRDAVKKFLAGIH